MTGILKRKRGLLWIFAGLAAGLYGCVIILCLCKGMQELLLSSLEMLKGDGIDRTIWYERFSSGEVWSFLMPLHILFLTGAVFITEFTGGVKIYLKAGLLVLLTWYQTELAACYDRLWESGVYVPRYLLLNLLTVAAVFLLLISAAGNIRYGCIAGLVIFTAAAFVDHYVILFHGSPATMGDVTNIGIALQLAGGYEVKIDKAVLLVLLLALMEGIICYRMESEEAILRQRLRLGLLAVALTFIVIGYLTPISLKNERASGLSWAENYHNYGFMAMSVESIGNFFFKVEKPEGYSEERLSELDLHEDAGSDARPDIILVLNETFFDLRQVSDLQTDVDFMEAFDRLKEEGQYGYAIGQGGTVLSEYELLTSNSLRLIPGISPYAILDMEGAGSIVSELKSRGYYTLAAHPCPGKNYYRDKGYPALGFDEIHFQEDFKDMEPLGMRQQGRDADAYRNIMDWYEDMPEGPRFIFLLTMQNHSDYDENPPEYDTVHIKGDYGENEQRINEYLSCMQASCQALEEFVEELRHQDREVLLILAGDHKPILTDAVKSGTLSGNERVLREGSTPCFIWSNKEDSRKGDIGYISMTQLCPFAMREYGLPLSEYYSYVADLRDEVPYFTGNGLYSYKGAEQEAASIEEMPEALRDYFYLEYANIKEKRRNSP